MWGIVGNIGKEWFSGLHCTLDESNRLTREVIDAETLTLDRTTVPLKKRAIIVTPVATAETIELAEPTPVWVVGVLHAVMPFTERTG